MRICQPYDTRNDRLTASLSLCSSTGIIRTNLLALALSQEPIIESINMMQWRQCRRAAPAYESRLRISILYMELHGLPQARYVILRIISGK